MQFTKSIVVKALIWHVWDCFEDIEKQKQWMTNLIDIEEFDDDSSIIYIKEGNYVDIYKEQILEFDPPHRLHVYIHDEKRKVDVYLDYTLYQEGNFTILEFSGQVKANTMRMKLIEVAPLGYFNKISMNKFLNNIKKLAEEYYIS